MARLENTNTIKELLFCFVLSFFLLVERKIVVALVSFTRFDQLKSSNPMMSPYAPSTNSMTAPNAGVSNNNLTQPYLTALSLLMLIS